MAVTEPKQVRIQFKGGSHAARLAFARDTVLLDEALTQWAAGHNQYHMHGKPYTYSTHNGWVIRIGLTYPVKMGDGNDLRQGVAKVCNRVLRLKAHRVVGIWVEGQEPRESDKVDGGYRRGYLT